MSLRLAMDLQA
uniref:Calcium-dependent protein kinase n=1 Tax=Arundo donax TaxID=35708 RepID=A0A0A8XPI7_ARUDO